MPYLFSKARQEIFYYDLNLMKVAHSHFAERKKITFDI